MSFKTIPVILLLTLSILASISYDISPARAVLETLPTSWSPYGPSNGTLSINIYSNPTTMFSNFKSGNIDITDWPVNATSISNYCSNTLATADFACTSPVDNELGVFSLDVNVRNNFFAVTQFASRGALVGSISGIVTGAGCSAGFGSLSLTLNNIEASPTIPSGIFKNTFNLVTASNQPTGTPSFTAGDSGSPGPPNGVYTFPCMLAGTYLLTGSMVTGNSTTNHLGCGVAGGCTITVAAGTATTATWNVLYNSPSTNSLTLNGVWVRRALAHLIDKESFVAGVMGGKAVCDDTMLSPAIPIAGSPCNPSPPGLPMADLTQECAPGVLTPDTGIGGYIPTGVCSSTPPPPSPSSGYHLQNPPVSIGGCATPPCPAFRAWWGSVGVSFAGATAGYSSPEDIDAACQYFMKTNLFTIFGGAQNTCAEVATASTLANPPVPITNYAHLQPSGGVAPIIYIRDDNVSKSFGQIIADSLNFLLGSPNDTGCNIKYGTVAGPICPHAYVGTLVATPAVLSAPSGLWNLYAGYTQQGSTPDSLFTRYHSEFAGSVCGGAANSRPSNYLSYCDPQFDSLASAAKYSSQPLVVQYSIFAEATEASFQDAMNVPVLSRLQQFVALNGWNLPGTQSSLVSSLGHGFGPGGAYWALINMRQVPGYTATPPYQPGGGNPSLIRRGYSEDINTLNPFIAVSPWESELTSLVFDTMLKTNPTSGGTTMQVLDWMTTSHSSTFAANEFSCIPPPSVAVTSCVKGTTTLTWHLRSDLFFHDGIPVTCQDIVYSILTQRDDPSASGFPAVVSVANAACLDPNTVQVKLESNSAYFELNIGSIPIIPQHLWQGPGGSICGSISSIATPAGPENAVSNGPASACADPAFDPFTCTGTGGVVPGCGVSFADGSFQGIFVGSGPYICINAGTGTQASGKAGGSCAENGAGAITGSRSLTVGSRVLLTANGNYMRGVRNGQGNSLQKGNWADFTKDGEVNIADASNMALFFGTTNSYWAHPQYDCGVPPGYNLSVDPKLKFVDSPIAPAPNTPGTWVQGKTLIYDADSSGTYTKGDTVISGTTPLIGTNLSVDPKLKFVDSPMPAAPNTPGTWASGKTIIYDSDNSGTYTAGDTRVDFVDVCVAAALLVYFDTGFISPFGGNLANPCPSMLVTCDPQLDPYQATFATSAGTTATVYYQMTGKGLGLRTACAAPCTQLIILSGTPIGASFTAMACAAPLASVTAAGCTQVSGAPITGTATVGGSFITITWSSPLTPTTHYDITISYNYGAGPQQLYVPPILIP